MLLWENTGGCPGGCNPRRWSAAMWLPVKSLFLPPSTRALASFRDPKRHDHQVRQCGDHLLRQSAGFIIPLIRIWQPSWGEFCLVRMAVLLLYRMKSCLFHFVKLQDKSSIQFFVYQGTTCLPFVKGLDCLWEILVWNQSIPPTEEGRNAEIWGKRQRTKSWVFGSPGNWAIIRETTVLAHSCDYLYFIDWQTEVQRSHDLPELQQLVNYQPQI